MEGDCLGVCPHKNSLKETFAIGIVAFCLSFLFYAISTCFIFSQSLSRGHGIYVLNPVSTYQHIERALGTNRNIGMVFTASTSIRIIAMI